MNEYFHQVTDRKFQKYSQSKFLVACIDVRLLRSHLCLIYNLPQTVLIKIKIIITATTWTICEEVWFRTVEKLCLLTYKN